MCVCAMKSPFPIKSEEYAKAWQMLESAGEEIPRVMRVLLRRKPDSFGTYKKAYFVTNESGVEWVFLLEIGSLDFKTYRNNLLKKLSKFGSSYARSANVIVPKKYAEREVSFVDENGEEKFYYFLVSKTRRCSMDLFQSIKSMSVQDPVRMLSRFVDLMVVLIDFLDNGLFFTDVKAENVIDCGDHLAYIDLDSMITAKEIAMGNGAIMSPPAASLFRSIKSVFIIEDESRSGRQKLDDRYQMYRFYTLFAFAWMVLESYIRVTEGVSLEFGSIPELRAVERSLDLLLTFDVEDAEVLRKLLFLSQQTVEAVVYGLDLETAYEISNSWYAFSDPFLKLQRTEKIKQKRERRIGASALSKWREESEREAMERRRSKRKRDKDNPLGLRIKVPRRVGVLLRSLKF